MKSKLFDLGALSEATVGEVLKELAELDANSSSIRACDKAGKTVAAVVFLRGPNAPELYEALERKSGEIWERDE